jgi:hypothetical protein
MTDFLYFCFFYESFYMAALIERKTRQSEKQKIEKNKKTKKTKNANS